MKNIFHFIFLNALFVCVAFFSMQGHAEQSKDILSDSYIESQRRLSLARLFVSKLKAGLARGDHQLLASGHVDESSFLEDGETLLLQPVLSGKLHVDGVIFGQMRSRKVLLSLRDISSVLQIPIELDLENNIAQGWYVREEKTFFLDLNQRVARTDHGEFAVSDAVIIENDDIFVPLGEFGQWIDFELKPKISEQELRISSTEVLPIEARYNRRQERSKAKARAEPSLPRGGESYQDVSIPVVDVATRSTYRQNGDDDAEAVKTHSATVRTVGDFGRGTLVTQSQINNVDQLRSVRANYKRESVGPELLGPLKARRFEVGDVSTTNIPLGGQVAQELGVRVTNTNALRTFSTPTTGISGTGFPGWDVELYRDNQFVAFREIGEDGFYEFSNIDLFRTNNTFRLVFYGPQGEVREEEVFVPVDSGTLGRGEGIYDVSLSLDGENTFNKKTGGVEDPDEGTLNVAALYERPIADGLTVSAGLRSHENDEERDTVGNIGVSAIVEQVLVNAGVAVDDEGDVFSELALRRDFGEHEVGNTLSWRGKNFDTQNGDGGGTLGSLQNSFRVNGPLPIGIGSRPRYNIATNYVVNDDGDYTLLSSLGANTSWKRLAFNEVLTHSTASGVSEDQMNFQSNVTGTYGRNRVRLAASYEIKPESDLRNVLATYRRDFTRDIDLELGVSKQYQQALTEYSAKLDWQAGFARLSPSVTYNSEQDFLAVLNTRFSALRDPTQGRVKFYDRNITNVGGASVFVYLDKDGNGKFNGEDEPLENVEVDAPQNGGRVVTDENGVALFTRMSKLRLTDVYIDEDSLQDPTWVNGFEGVSILPREGYVAELSFPIHISGEIDGSVYVKAVAFPRFDEETGGEILVETKPVPLRGVGVSLYDEEGDLTQRVDTDSGGFYYFPRIAPGRYLLIIDESSAARAKFIRPEPQMVEIGYDGTVLYGNNLYVETGEGDVSSSFISDLDDYKARHPHIDFDPGAHDLVLNLGEYNSRLLMSVVWYKIRGRYGDIIADSDLFVPPTQSYADVKTGKHTLRVGLSDQTLDRAYSRCRALMARNVYCKVEIYPSYLKQARVDVIE